MRTRRIALVLVLLAAAVGFVSSPAAAQSASDVITIDEKTELTSDTQRERWAQEGVATGSASRYDLTITVAKDRRDAGSEALTPNPMYNGNIQVQYNESYERTYRVYIPAEYIQPRLTYGVKAAEGNLTADFEPVAGGDYMAMTFTVDGPTDARFAFNRVISWRVEAEDQGSDLVYNLTGYEPLRPATSGVDQWEHVPDEALESNDSRYIVPKPPEDEANTTDITIQYDRAADDSSEEPTWRTVHDCETQLEPVCILEGDTNQTVLLAPSGDAPPVRYKYGSDGISNVQTGVGEAFDAIGSMVDDIGGLLGGDD
jgi:hypothetical protein